MKLVGPRIQSGRGGEEKEAHHCLCRELSPCRPAHGLVTVLAELPWLLLLQAVGD
jgi:hypothetical protein